MEVLSEYISYHSESSAAKDIDPANDCLRYICDRFELNIEQRYWMAFLYASTYSSASAFYMYNEFPDYENVDVGRMRIWWEKNKDKVIFQTDRRWTKSRNQFVDSFISYKSFIGGVTQKQRFGMINTGNKDLTYEICMKECANIFTFGRFTLFIYLEMINNLTGFPLEPTKLDLKNAESSRNGLCFAIGREDLMNHFTGSKIQGKDISMLQGRLVELKKIISDKGIQHASIWNIETTLCAFKKFKLKKRWVGYYIERQKKEIEQMEEAVQEGVCWDVLWQFRRETYNKKYL